MGRIIKHNPTGMKRKAKFLVDSISALIETRKRMLEIIKRLQDSFDGGPDAAVFRNKSSEYVRELQKIEDSLIQYVNAFGNVTSDYGKTNEEYSMGQRGRKNEFIQIQK